MRKPFRRSVLRALGALGVGATTTATATAQPLPPGKLTITHAGGAAVTVAVMVTDALYAEEDGVWTRIEDGGGAATTYEATVSTATPRATIRFAGAVARLNASRGDVDIVITQRRGR